jgi:hypothetical protein
MRVYSFEVCLHFVVLIDEFLVISLLILLGVDVSWIVEAVGWDGGPG